MTIFFFIETMKMSLTPDKVIKIVLSSNAETIINPNDEIFQDGNALVIERESGNRVIVNIDYITMVCTVKYRVI
jgi:hypothetical protein